MERRRSGNCGPPNKSPLPLWGRGQGGGVAPLAYCFTHHTGGEAPSPNPLPRCAGARAKVSGRRVHFSLEECAQQKRCPVRALIVLPVLAVLSSATAALADPPPPGTIMKVTPPAQGTMPMPEK